MLGWSGKLPVPEYSQDGRPPRRTILTADLVDLWNASFFLRRGVEVVLYKGRERRTGRNAGIVDVNLPGFDDYPGAEDEDDYDDDDSDDYDDYGDRYRYGAYGKRIESQMSQWQQARRIRQERRRADQKHHNNRRNRRTPKETENTYSLWVTCVQPE